MSEENVEVVRQGVAVSAHSDRHLEERLGLRFPRILELGVRAMSRLPPRSRLRQMMLRRAMRIAAEATNRNDLEAAFLVALSPDYETVPAKELIALGFDPVYRGREGRIRYHRAWIAELGSFRLEPEQIIDRGDRVLVLARARGTGSGSGAEFNDEVAILVTLGGGRVLREAHFRTHKQALEAAGLSA